MQAAATLDGGTNTLTGLRCHLLGSFTSEYDIRCPFFEYHLHPRCLWERGWDVRVNGPPPPTSSLCDMAAGEARWLMASEVGTCGGGRLYEMGPFHAAW